MDERKILIVEDEVITAMNIRSKLEKKGYIITGIASSSEEALSLVENDKPDLILMDCTLDGPLDGIETYKKIKEKHDIPVVYCTAHSDDVTLARAKLTDPYGYVLKPVSPGELFTIIEIALYKHEMQKKLMDSETRYRTLYSNMSEGVCLHSVVYDNKGNPVDYVIDDVNRAYELIIGIKRDDAVGKRSTELYGTETPPYNEIYFKVAEKGEPVSFEAYYAPMNKHFYISVFSPAEGKFATVFMDITGKKVAEEELRHKNEELAAANEELAAAIEEVESQNEAIIAEFQNKFTSNRRMRREDYNILFETLPQGVVFQNPHGEILTANHSAEKILGISVQNLIGKTSRESIWESVDENGNTVTGDNHPSMITIKSGLPVNNRVMGIKNQKSGVRVWLKINSHPLFNEGETKPSAVYTIFEDITEHKRWGDDLRESEEKFRALSESSPTAIMIYQNDRWIYANHSAERITGYTADELYTMCFWELTHPDFRDIATERGKKRQNAEATIQRYELKIITKNGVELWVDLSGSSTYIGGKPAALISVFEIERSKNIQEELKESLTEKETLLREIHHRVKNNMQIISSLLGLQSDRIASLPVKRLFLEAEGRIRAMGLVHEKLYRTESFTHINLKDYAESLIAEIAMLYDRQETCIRTDVQGAGIILEIERAVPCGLIINELISNCYKHGFSGLNEGRVILDIFIDSCENYVLSVRDNGIGLPENFIPDSSDSMGFNLINALAGQLKGRVEINRDKGTSVSVTFPSLQHK